MLIFLYVSIYSYYLLFRIFTYMNKYYFVFDSIVNSDQNKKKKLFPPEREKLFFLSLEMLFSYYDGLFEQEKWKSYFTRYLYYKVIIHKINLKKVVQVKKKYTQQLDGLIQTVIYSQPYLCSTTKRIRLKIYWSNLTVLYDLTCCWLYKESNKILKKKSH
jgi:hypothetical protein